MRNSILIAVMAAGAIAAAPAPPADEGVQPVLPGIVSTPGAIEIRLTFSPDGNRLLWGRIDPDSQDGFEIYESVRQADSAWSAPHPVPFNSRDNDFDPFFARDGRSVLFFSNRAGGMGGDDIWSVPFDPATGSYGTPVNLGAPVNTAGEEWAPSLSADGNELLFSSNGHGGAGGQDLFRARRTATGWATPESLGPGVNGPDDDFDATFVGNDTLIYTSGDATQSPIALYRAKRTAAAFTGHDRLPAPFNCAKTFNLGPAWNPREPDALYFSAACGPAEDGGADIYRGTLAKSAD